MSSVPYIHSAEGRDWKGILRGFAGGNPPVNRIHLPCYSEVAPKDYLLRFHQVSMANRALIPEETEVYPELENYPYSLFAKSRRFTRFQILSALPLNLAGITIDLFDLNGSGIVLADGHQDMLREIKPFLNEITRRGVMGMEKLGVRVMLSETSSYMLHTSGDLRMEELYPHEVYYAGVLNAMGISVQYCTDPSVEGCVCAVSGQYFRNLSSEQIRHLFEKNALLLSGDAVETLCEMGLGMLAGVESCRWMQQNGGEYAYEQVCLEEPMGGLRHARASALIASTDVLNITYAAKPEMHTWFFDSFRRKAAPGHTLVNGSILIDPFGHFSAPNDIPPMQLNAVRRDLMQYAFMRMPGGKSIPMTVEAAYLQPFCTREDGRLHVYLVNASHDDAEVIRLRIEKKPTRVILLRSDCSESEPAWQFDAGVLTIQKNLDSLDACLLTIEE